MISKNKKLTGLEFDQRLNRNINRLSFHTDRSSYQSYHSNKINKRQKNSLLYLVETIDHVTLQFISTLSQKNNVFEIYDS